MQDTMCLAPERKYPKLPCSGHDPNVVSRSGPLWAVLMSLGRREVRINVTLRLGAEYVCFD